jgi:hypothetical protein
MRPLGKYSIGLGDRFGRQGRAQLRALVMARELGVEVAPVWNKSHREHTLLRSHPTSVRREADEATAALGWRADYHVDADHIGLSTVTPFLETHDFFTLDVADFIGRETDPDDARAFVTRHRALTLPLDVPGLDEPLRISPEVFSLAVHRYLPAVREAGRIYRRIRAARGEGCFVTELSMDEVASPQTPEELLVILTAVAEEGIPLQTIAPRFSGLFAKGVDYAGDVAQLAREVDRDLCVLRHARSALGLPADLKLSVHSGSDKPSLYGPLRRVLRRHGAGLHLKTAGTTWLEELAGLCQGGGDGLAIAGEILAGALARVRDLCEPYAAVIAIDPERLPSADAVSRWDGETFARALRRDPACPSYNPHLRQLLHVAYRLAGEMGPRWLAALDRHEETIARNVTENIFARHLRPLFIDDDAPQERPAG